jgi:uncharacterized protein (DUF433 family)
MTATLVAPGIERRSDRGLAIAGSRLTLYEIMDLIKNGRSADQILEIYPLTVAQLQSAYDYFAAHGEEFEAEYRRVVRESEERERYWRARQVEWERTMVRPPDTPEKAAIRARLAAVKAQRGME